MSSHAEQFDFRANSMDWLRLFAAFCVVLVHTLMWLSPPCANLLRQFCIFPGLLILFVMSGYLVSSSIERSGSNWRDFWRRRLARIYPGLWACFLVSSVAVVILTRLYDIPVSPLSWCKWIAAQLSFFQFYTPPDLKAYGIGNPNGVLWMIPLQLCMYAVMLLSYRRLSGWSMPAWLLLLAALVGVNILSGWLFSNLNGIAARLLYVCFVPYMYAFYIGMFAYVFRRRVIPVLRKYCWLLLAAYIVWVKGNALWWNIPVPGLYSEIVMGVLICFVSLGVAYRLGRHTLRHDYSYPAFLYHEIFINIFVVVGFTRNWWAVAAVFLCTAVCSVLSCRLIEEPAAKWLRPAAKK